MGLPTGVKRPVGRALIVGGASARGTALSAMQGLGFTCSQVDDPYAAAAELCKRPLVYRALILSLTSLYREELGLIAMIRQRLPHVDVWLTHTEGRQAALVEAFRLGANGLLGEDGVLHPIAPAASSQSATVVDESTLPSMPPPQPTLGERMLEDTEHDHHDNEPVLSADELRALLQEQPTLPPEMES